MRGRPLLALLAAGSAVAASAGQDDPPLAAARAECALTVDGRLDEPCWAQRLAALPMVQRQPDEGVPATERTELAILYDDRAVYIGARMYTGAASSELANLSRRDELGAEERLTVTFDSYRDRRTAYAFSVSAAGVRADWYHPDDDDGSRDFAFDPVWEARTGRGDGFWTAELRIPFAQVRFSAPGAQPWGINVTRSLPSRNEQTYFALVRKDQTGWSSRFPALAGLEYDRRALRLEVLPYVAGNAQLEAPYQAGPQWAGKGGLDLKLGLGPDLTLEGTANPDFGQVEVDPAQINLSAFETLFAERRPFFVERERLLRGEGRSFFYSRRIGAAPPLPPPPGVNSAPTSTPILGALKLTGTTSSGTSIGSLAALTAPLSAPSSDPAAGPVQLAPLTGYGVLRLEQRTGENSRVGGSLTTALRSIPAGDAYLAALPDRAVVAGVDFVQQLGSRDFVARGDVAASDVAGHPEAIARLQTASSRYFQRPDQGYVQPDPAATRMTGFAGRLELARQEGSRFLWNVGVDTNSPTFEINDVGQANTADDIDVFVTVRYHQTVPNALFQEYEVGLSGRQNWNYGGVPQGTQPFELFFHSTWRNFWTTNASLYYLPRSYDDSATRGGPLFQYPDWGGLEVAFATPESQRLRLEVIADLQADVAGTRGLGLFPTLSYQSPLFRLAFQPRLYLVRGSRQYVDTVDGGPQETYGRRYLFSFLDRSEIAAEVHASVYFTPELTFEAYAQAFTSSGAYFRFGQLAAAGSSELRFYGEEAGTSIARSPERDLEIADGADRFTVPNPDYLVDLFRSTAVLRWEWRLGSTLYLVWQQDLYAQSSTPATAALRLPFRGLTAPGRQSLLLKASFWLPFD